jgi:hypothetical protein
MMGLSVKCEGTHQLAQGHLLPSHLEDSHKDLATKGQDITGIEYCKILQSRLQSLILSLLLSGEDFPGMHFRLYSSYSRGITKSSFATK